MREILVLQVGGFGNKMGLKFWEEMIKDCEFNNEQVGSNNNNSLFNTSNVVYYNLQEKKPLPRAIQVDLGQDLPFTNVDFNPCNQFSFNYSSGNNFGYVKNNCSNEITDILIDSIRQEIEQCDSFQGVQIFASIIGGTGSGLSAILSDRIKEEYQSIITQCNLLVPSIQQNDLCVVSPYNSTLAFNMLMDSAEQLIFYDNQGLKQNFTRLGNTFEYDNANLLVAQTISCNSSPFRHPGDINSSLRKLSTNLIPFPELKLLTSGLTNNLYSDYYKEYLQMNEYQVFKELMSTDHNQASTDYTHGRFLTAALSLRGNISNKEIDKETSLFQNFIENYNSYYKSNIARKVFQVNMFFTNICKKSYQNFDYFGSCLVNSTSISESLKSLDEKFSKMQIRKSYMYKYTQEGIEEDEFIEAQTRLRDTCHYYEDRNTQEMGENQEYYE